MTQTAQDIISTFDSLPPSEQTEVAKIILRRNLLSDEPSLSDDDLVLNAEQIFLDLDRSEAEDAGS